jgi:hypothetical protein
MACHLNGVDFFLILLHCDQLSLGFKLIYIIPLELINDKGSLTYMYICSKYWLFFSILSCHVFNDFDTKPLDDQCYFFQCHACGIHVRFKWTIL